MKGDLLTRTFPHLLSSLSTATKVQLQAGLTAAASRIAGRAPPLRLTLSSVPLPGSADVGTVFVATTTPDVDQRSLEEGAAYKDVFRRFFKDSLGSKPMMLKLLATVGVT